MPAYGCVFAMVDTGLDQTGHGPMAQSGDLQNRSSSSEERGGNRKMNWTLSPPLVWHFLPLAWIFPLRIQDHAANISHPPLYHL